MENGTGFVGDARSMAGLHLFFDGWSSAMVASDLLVIL
jgi:hypothetical protein